MTDPVSEKSPNTSADVQAEIARIFDEARDRALALVAAQSTASTTTPEPDWITRGEAAAIRRCSLETMTEYIKKFGLGVKIGPTPWRVDKRRFYAWMEGRPFEPLSSPSSSDPQEDAKSS